MPSTRSSWTLVFSLLLLLQPALAVADGVPVDVTILQTVNLPWQAPEVIVTTQAAVDELRIEVSVDGAAGPAQQLTSLPAGATRSLTWAAAAGAHRCSVRVTGKSAAAGSFMREWSAEVIVAPPLEVSFRPADVDLSSRKLRFSANAEITFAELSIYDMDGQLLHQSSPSFDADVPGRPNSVRWPPLTAAAAKLALRVFSSADRWADVEWTPIQIEIPHAPIYFDEGMAIVDQRDQIEAAYGTVRDSVRSNAGVPGLKLYVLAITEQPQKLGDAARSAKAVADYLSKRGGLRLPILSASSAESGVSLEVSGRLGYVQAILSIAPPTQAEWIAAASARASVTERLRARSR